MGKALYRKHRPKKLADVVGQEHITTTLENALKNSGVSHAYLFTGPRGTGKTSIARILAHEVNKLPYDEDATHLDIIEIDAASNRRIDEIRTLRERVHNAPASAKYKVYIIDEVHMLTREAFNALLKTLEEPPTHAIFILATTEVHKLPETIISRTQRFTFKPVGRSKAIAHLRHIADEEGIDITDEALDLIAHHGGGSFRDSISLLDQLGSHGAVVDLAAAQQALGIAPSEAIAELIDALFAGSVENLLKLLQTLHNQGYQAPQIAKQLAQSLRHKLLEDGPLAGKPEVTELLRKLIDVPTSHDPNALLEIVLLEVALSGVDDGRWTIDDREKPQPKTPETPSPQKEAKEHKETKASKPKPQTSNVQRPTSNLDETAWQNVLQALKSKHNTLYGIARMATPLFKDGNLTLVFAFPFHQKRLNDAKTKQIISDIITEQTSQSVAITCIVDKTKSSAEQQPLPNSKIQNPKSNLEAVSNIFGDAEVLE